jgi:replicative DNA helicase
MNKTESQPSTWRGPRALPDTNAPIAAVEAETSLLACALGDESGVSLSRLLAAGITHQAFYDTRHRSIFKKISDLAKGGIRIDILVVAEELRKTGEIDSAGGMEYLLELTSIQPTALRFGYFLDRVREVWVLRQLHRAAAEVAETCKQVAHGEVEDDPAAVLSGFARRLNRMADFLSHRAGSTLRERMDRRLELSLAAAAGNVDRSRWLHTGLRSVDNTFLPFDVNQEDWMIVVAGPPSGGKSSVMRQFALNLLDEGKRGAVILLETGLRWVEAAAASMARVNLRELHQAPKDRLEVFEKRFRELNALADERLFIFEDLRFIEDIERTVREIHRNLREKDLEKGIPESAARGLDFIVLDYLQIVETKEKFRMREAQVSAVSRAVKMMLKSLNITGFVGAQISRSGREDQSKPPQLSALRESGAIEQDADRAIFVYTPPTNTAGIEQNGNQSIDEVWWIQRKSRNGPRDVVVKLEFAKRWTWYNDTAGPGEPRPGQPKPSNGYKRPSQS